MKQKTQQVFVKVTKTYTAKNALEKQVSNELLRLDNLFLNNLFQAQLEIKMAINRATKECLTAKQCKPLTTSFWDTKGSTKCFRVNEVIQMAIYPVFIKSN